MKEYPCRFTRAELEKRCAGRFFDQIAVVVDSLAEKKKNLTEIYGLTQWYGPEYEASWHGTCASAWMDQVELKLIEPRDGIWLEFLRKYDSGIACVREVLDAEGFAAEQRRYASLGIAEADRFCDGDGETVVYDMTDRLGGFFAIHLRSPDWKLPERRNDRKLCQINITTDDVDRTCADVAELLEIGPYGIGTVSSETTTNSGLLVDGVWRQEIFSIQLGMAAAGNLEFEVIAPTYGPTVYQTSVDRRGVGYHHIKEITPLETQEQIWQDYIDRGMPLCIRGTLVNTSFAYLYSEKEFGFYVEMGDGLPPDYMPEGYNLYLYPAE